jgi:hypothetical protein
MAKHVVHEEFGFNGTVTRVWLYCTCGWSDGPLPNDGDEIRRSKALHFDFVEARRKAVDPEDEFYGFTVTNGLDQTDQADLISS